MISSIWESMASWFTPSSLFLFLNLMIGTIVIMSRFGADRIPQQLHQHQDQLSHYDSPPPLARAPSLLERVKSIDFSFYKFNPPAPETEHLQSTEHRYEPQHYPKPHNPHQLGRQPSLLHRLKSIFSLYKFEQLPNPETKHLHPTEPEFVTHNPSPLARQPSLLDHFKTFNFPSFYPHEQANPEIETESNPNGDPSPSNSHLVKRSISELPSGASKKSQQVKIRKSVSEKSKAGNLEENDENVELVMQATMRVDGRISGQNRENDTVSSGEDDGVDAKADDFINSFKKQLRLQRLDSLERFGEIFIGK